MKTFIKAVSEKLKILFGYGIMVTMMLGAVLFIGYLTAIIIGGERAAVICVFLYKKLVPVMVYMSTIMIVIGLLAMYLSGEKALVPDEKVDKNCLDR